MLPSADPELGLPCSQWSLDFDEPLAGTATTTNGYLAIEQSGSWGRDALTGSAIPADVAAALELRLAEHGLSGLLIRRPGRSPDRAHRSGRQVFASVVGDQPVTVSFRVAGVEDLLTLDWSQFGSATLTALYRDAVPVSEPVALICAHAKRDRCCAAKGRPLAAQLARSLAGGTAAEAARADYELVWECSHLGGHRLAPTALLLPAGAVYGRLDADSLAAVYSAAQSDSVVPEQLRGMARFPKAVQAAEIAVRRQAGITTVASPALVSTQVDGERTSVVFGEPDRQWLVRIRQQPVATPRPESCGKSPAQPSVCTVEEISLLPATT